MPAKKKKQEKKETPFLRKLTRMSWPALLGVLFLGVLVIAMTTFTTPDTTGPMYLTLINLNLLLASAFILFIGRRFLLMFLERRQGMIGTRLHVRLMGIFSLLAMLPTALVAICAIFLLNQGLESWFSQRVTGALDGSLEVAQAYFKEHGNRLLAEAKSITRDPNLHSSGFLIDPETVQEVLQHEKTERNLSELSLYYKDGSLFVHAGDALPVPPTIDMLDVFNSPEPESTLLPRYEDGRLVAVAPVDENTFLVATRWVHPSVLGHLDDTRQAYQEYYQLRSERDTLRIVFTVMLILLAILSLAWAVWAGFKLASRIVRPVTSLVHATNRVSAGELDVRVEPLDDDEIGILTQAFNRMTRQLQENRQLLERKNRELDDRRRMMEAVLTGVTAGVMSLDEQGIIRVANKVARDVLHVRVGSKIGKFLPELEEQFDLFMEKGLDVYQEQVRVEVEGEPLMLLVRMVPQRAGGGKIQSVVVTFDDITALISAQRVAAWSDVARRIAHEIKNPLTPIQLSAERLKRKYLPNIEDNKDKKTFESLTDTISRQVEDLRLLVNEFSDFARMPAAQFDQHDLVEIVEEVLVLERTARPQITFDTDYFESKIPFVCDRSHVSRALTNLVENAVNAIEEADAAGKKKSRKQVKVVVKMSQRDTLNLSVLDTGKGLPDEMEVERLFDPYVTTRAKGTGLGLSIVRRVVDEHGGQIRLLKRKSGGTCVEMSFPVKEMVK